MKLLKEATDFYFNSHDFNGVSGEVLLHPVGARFERLAVGELVLSGNFVLQRV